jgi:hypothetical protein
MLKIMVKEILINIYNNQNFLVFIVTTKPSIFIKIAKKFKN